MPPTWVFHDENCAEEEWGRYVDETVEHEPFDMEAASCDDEDTDEGA